MSKPAEIYIGRRSLLKHGTNTSQSKTSTAVYFKPDNALKYCQLDVVKEGSAYLIVDMFHGVDVHDEVELIDINSINDSMLKTFDLLDSVYK